ncbi:MAG: WhiB family transcriptional regulator, redox-sensing transcriptional regulator [Pseudonocardiales bacterium]|jgi:WhiB family redox-sensing transcriptional regulator|nr:uncharacterized protein [Pseudonocardia sp.]MDT7618816.1 WhiB family transcriptional regulator, redox-sensing transcriptional regulator [Pseudonocardiales bacterium]MDT7706193.1 WhiB family transcriptional regulator, redox-sensing transcriptional regulator [Pseudonocardiales bacterium]
MTRGRTSTHGAPPVVRAADAAWMEHAACRNLDPETFFPIGSGLPAQRQARAAKAVCRPCSVREQCLRWAMRAGHEEGVWGGLDADERREAQRRLRNPADQVPEQVPNR